MLAGLEQWVAQCAPQVSPVTMMAIVRVESGGNPLALNINGSMSLARQPRSPAEAVGWARWLMAKGYSIDMGLAQVNSGNLRRLDLSVGQMFEPCANLAAGARILARSYSRAARRYGEGQAALQAALSAYNTGNHQHGMRNGYVAKVARSAYENVTLANPPPLMFKLPKATESVKPKPGVNATEAMSYVLPRQTLLDTPRHTTGRGSD